MPRRNSLAMRTRVLAFLDEDQQVAPDQMEKFTYKISRLLLVCELFSLLQELLFSERWAEHIAKISRRCARRPHRALERTLHGRLWCHGWVVVVVCIRHLHGLVLVHIAEAHV